jgi:hypothetical protein
MAPRRATRATPRQLAAYERKAAKADLQEIVKEANRRLARGIQEAVISSVNGLVDAGPAWSGEFSASWDFVPEGQPGVQSRGSGSIYRYSKKDFDVIKIEKYIKAGIKRFEIVNTSEHANIAIDAELSTYRQIGEPLKPNKFIGWRPTSETGNQVGSLRGDLSSATFQDGTAGTATAPLDWYVTYTRGGSLTLNFKKGFSAGFRGYF